MRANPASAVVLFASFATIAAIASSGCAAEEKQYEKKKAASGQAANLPNVPTLPPLKRKDGDAYTIAGAVHDLHSVVHVDEVKDKKITLSGFIVKTNLVACSDPKEKDGTKEGCTPECAVHEGHKKGDPADCIAPVPTFWIADSKDEKDNLVQVMGWASNFARIYDAIELIDKTAKDKRGTDKDFVEKMTDTSWTVLVPDPLPAVGAVVKVTGTYGATFNRGTHLAADPKHGILNYESMVYVSPAPELANLPTLKPRKKDKDAK